MVSGFPTCPPAAAQREGMPPWARREGIAPDASGPRYRDQQSVLPRPTVRATATSGPRYRDQRSALPRPTVRATATNGRGFMANVEGRARWQRIMSLREAILLRILPSFP